MMCKLMHAFFDFTLQPLSVCGVAAGKPASAEASFAV